MMQSWLLLVGAIVLEVAGTTSLIVLGIVGLNLGGPEH